MIHLPQAVRPDVQREYRRLRAKGERAKDALHAAQVNTAFADYEAQGLVKIEWRVDEELFDDSYLETWGHSPERLARERKELWALIEREGVWGIVASFRPFPSARWVGADESVWGFIGIDADDAYEIKYAALEGLDAAWEREAEALAERGTFAGGIR